MRRLDIYPNHRPLPALVQRTRPLDRASLPDLGKTGKDCKLCPLHKGIDPSTGTVCMTAWGHPGGLLIVGEAPGKEENRQGVPFIGRSGQYLRALLKKHWDGPVAVDNALRCLPQEDTKIQTRWVDRCRGYLSQTLLEVSPTRVVLLGAHAAYSFFGRAIAPYTNRKGYAFIDVGSGVVPVFFVLHPAAALRNEFVRAWFEEDLAWALTAHPSQETLTAEARIVEDPVDAWDAVSDLSDYDWLAFDIETRGSMWTDTFAVITVAVSGAGSNYAWVWGSKGVDDPACAQALEALLGGPIPKVGQNVKFDCLGVHHHYHFQVQPIKGDTRIRRRLQLANASADLENMLNLVGMSDVKQEAAAFEAARLSEIKRAINAKAKGTKVRKALVDIPKWAEDAWRKGENLKRYQVALLSEDHRVRYCANDAIGTGKIEVKLCKDLASDSGLARVWDEISLPTAVALEYVERWGVPISRDAVMLFDAYLVEGIRKQMEVLSQYAGPDMNWGSHPQKVALFRKLKFPIVMKTNKGQESTCAEALEKLSQITRHPLPMALCEYTHLSGYRTKYAAGKDKYGRQAGLIPWIQADGRIHPNIKLDGTETGRPSCVDPNMFTLPRSGTPEGKMARDCVVAPPGWVIVEADQAQVELRFACYLSGDPVMLQAFLDGADLHMQTARIISQAAWGHGPDLVTDEERNLAKSVIFGRLYGKTAKTFAREWGMEEPVVQKIMDLVLGRFPTLVKWCETQVRQARRDGFVATSWRGMPARKRLLLHINDPDKRSLQRSTDENSAVNTPCQGGAVDVTNKSLAMVVEWILKEKLEDRVQVILSVYDSIMSICREDLAPMVGARMKEIMESHDLGPVPLKADLKIGRSWGSMEKYSV